MNYHLVSIVLFLFIYSVSIIIACKPKGVSNNVLLGQTTYVCLFLGPLEFQKSGKIIQIAAEFKADELSSFTIPGCNSYFKIIIYFLFRFYDYY